MTVTLITGTSTGIGLATAIRLAGAGHKVYAGVRNPAGAINLKKVIDEGKLPISMLEIDLQDEKSITDAVARMLAAEGRIDVLVNNAGIGRGSSVEETPIALAREMFETNFFGLACLTKAVLPNMRERRSGAIVNVSSLNGRVSTPTSGYYVASKFALEGLSESLAMEVRPFNIRVAIIEPGVVATAIFENARKAQAAPDPNSPYARFRRRMMAFFTTQLTRSNPTQPDDVAEVIEHAIATDHPKLRYMVGSDAKAFWVGCQRTSDEQMIAYAGIEDDDEYYDQMKSVNGQDLFRL